MNTEKMEVMSSVLANVEYNKKNKLLFITFKSGKTYIYYNVPEEVWKAFKDAESKGKFFNTYIKGRFSTEQ